MVAVSSESGHQVLVAQRTPSALSVQAYVDLESIPWVNLKTVPIQHNHRSYKIVANTELVQKKDLMNEIRMSKHNSFRAASGATCINQRRHIIGTDNIILNTLTWYKSVHGFFNLHDNIDFILIHTYFQTTN